MKKPAVSVIRAHAPKRIACKHKHRRVLSFEPHREQCMDCGATLPEKKET